VSVYHFRSPVGVFWIRPHPTRDDQVELGIDGETIASYHSAMVAADDVYLHATGWYEWDRLEEPGGPCDLSEWIPGEPSDSR
jgi:hypothetical protein